MGNKNKGTKSPGSSGHLNANGQELPGFGLEFRRPKVRKNLPVPARVGVLRDFEGCRFRGRPIRGVRFSRIRHLAWPGLGI